MNKVTKTASFPVDHRVVLLILDVLREGHEHLYEQLKMEDSVLVLTDATESLFYKSMVNTGCPMIHGYMIGVMAGQQIVEKFEVPHSFVSVIPQNLCVVYLDSSYRLHKAYLGKKRDLPS